MIASVLWKWQSLSRVQFFATLQVSSRNSLGQNTRVGSLSFLQGISPTQGSNPGLSHCGWILYQLSHREVLPKRQVFSPRCVHFMGQLRIWAGFTCRLQALSLWPSYFPGTLAAMNSILWVSKSAGLWTFARFPAWLCMDWGKTEGENMHKPLSSAVLF